MTLSVKQECFAPIEIGRYIPKQQLTNIPWQINMEPK